MQFGSGKFYDAAKTRSYCDQISVMIHLPVKSEDLGTVTKEKLSNMKTEDWFEDGGYATSVIASVFLGGAGAAGEAEKAAEAANVAAKEEEQQM